MDRHMVKTPREAAPQVLLERAALGDAPLDVLLAEQARRAEAERLWREGVAVKVRDGRHAELTPEERGLILAALTSGCLAA